MSKRNVVIVTGSAGLVGSKSVRYFSKRGYQIVGIDNDMRSRLFGREASTEWNRKLLQETIETYQHASIDIRDRAAVDAIFKQYATQLALIIHTAAQPSHDWAAKDPHEDFSINANGTLNLLEATRNNCSDVPFIFTSTNKVYGDKPNLLPLHESEARFELEASHRFAEFGIDESMSIDGSMHSLFGASKVAADILVQEYGRYFGMNTVCFRGGCLTGPSHSGTALHGFLAYLMKCVATGQQYTVLGYSGKQVRDNIHSEDLVSAFWNYFQDPRPGEVFNIGGGRNANCSMLEAIDMCEQISGQKLNYMYSDNNREGDHIWWVSDTRTFEHRFPDWSITRNVPQILEEIFDFNRLRWRKAS